MTGKPRANSANSIRKNHRAQLISELYNVPVVWLENVPCQDGVVTRWFYACHKHLAEFTRVEKLAVRDLPHEAYARCTMYDGAYRWTRVWQIDHALDHATYTTKRVTHSAPGIPPGQTVAVWRFHVKPNVDLTPEDHRLARSIQAEIEAEHCRPAIPTPITQAQRAQIFTAIGSLIGSLLQATEVDDLSPPLGIRELLAAISHAAQPDHWLG